MKEKKRKKAVTGCGSFEHLFSIGPGCGSQNLLARWWLTTIYNYTSRGSGAFFSKVTRDTWLIGIDVDKIRIYIKLKKPKPPPNL